MSGNTPKILIVVGVVIVVLFFVGIGVGASGGIGSISLDGVISSFSGLIPSPALTLDEISPSSSDCLDRTLQRIVVPKVGSCQFEIAASSTNIRALKLQITAGASVQLVLITSPVDGKPMTATTNLPDNGKDQATLNVYKFGTSSLTISQCVTAESACVLNIVS